MTNGDKITVVLHCVKDGQELTQKVNHIIQTLTANPGDSTEIQQFISKFTAADALRVSRVMSHYLNLANVAEQHHRVRATRYHI
jgi:phosphoenolpyruvate carboxylase